ncbi:MAG: hypothetical protein OXI72_20925 [Gemmatimonadota bacterium]|nr:hypothetical protein [Gemmatimonadota bacterium]
MRYLRSLKLLLVVAIIGAGLAFFERQRTAEHRHLLERTHARGQPQLKGTSLRELAQVLLELYPEGAEANLLMGTALADEGRLEEARVHLEQAMEVDRRNLQLLFLYARLLLDMGEDAKKVQEVVEELNRYFPRSREKVEQYFGEASKGKMRFGEDDLY